MAGARRFLVVVGTLAVLAVPQAAGAAAPKDTNLRVVPGVSIGEISLDQSVVSARAAWGGGKCKKSGPFINGEDNIFGEDDPGTCTFHVRGRGRASFRVGDPLNGGSGGDSSSDDESSDDEPYVTVVHEVSVSAWIVRVRNVVSRRGVTRVPTFAFATPYTSFRTTKGIKVGSTLASLRRAYPGARKREPDGITLFEYREYVQRSGDKQTIFSVANGRVFDILIEYRPT